MTSTVVYVALGCMIDYDDNLYHLEGPAELLGVFRDHAQAQLAVTAHQDLRSVWRLEDLAGITTMEQLKARLEEITAVVKLTVNGTHPSPDAPVWLVGVFDRPEFDSNLCGKPVSAWWDPRDAAEDVLRQASEMYREVSAIKDMEPEGAHEALMAVRAVPFEVLHEAFS